MSNQTRFIGRWSVGLLILTAPAWSQPPAPPPGAPGPPRLGSINYLEGQASINGMPLTPRSAGFAALEKDQTLATQAGKVEMLLTPGVFLRVAENSSVKMVSPDLANTRVQLDKGRAFVEVLNISSQNDIRIDQNGASTKILKDGLYSFDADHSQVRVFKGKAETTVGNQNVTFGKNREVALSAGAKPKASGFDAKAAEDEFYRWNSLRSGYLSEASVSAARAYVGPGPGVYRPGWTGFGWYWDPWFGVFTFLPGSEVYWGSFGWGFYSPFVVYRSPFFYHPGIRHGFGDFHYPYGHGVGPRSGGGFRGRGGPRGGGRR